MALYAAKQYSRAFIVLNNVNLDFVVGQIVIQFIIMEVEVLSKFLQTPSVPLLDLFMLLIISTIILYVMELYKIIRYSK